MNEITFSLPLSNGVVVSRAGGFDAFRAEIYQTQPNGIVSIELGKADAAKVVAAFQKALSLWDSEKEGARGKEREKEGDSAISPETLSRLARQAKVIAERFGPFELDVAECGCTPDCEQEIPWTIIARELVRTGASRRGVVASFSDAANANLFLARWMVEVMNAFPDVAEELQRLREGKGD